jgi:uncharacterized membrane protein
VPIVVAIRRFVENPVARRIFLSPAPGFFYLQPYHFLQMKRISSIDIARGLVMVIMALDHTRDFLHGWSRTNTPTDLAVTTPLLFFTRWITHFCAPAFVFLAGTSAALAIKASPDPRAARRWLLRRGLVLIVVEFTLVNFGLSFDPQFRLLIFEVIATIGAGFILLSFLSRLPVRFLLPLSILLIFGLGLLPTAGGMAPPPANETTLALSARIIRTLAFSLGGFQLTPRLLFTIAYPILPWLGIMLAGFTASRWFEKPGPERKKLFLRLGLFTVALFIALRLTNWYGDPSPWSPQKNPVFTLLSFLDVSKYPPSLLFTLMTLGGLFLLLAAAGQRDNRATRILLVYGRVPLFYFLVHFYLIHLIMFAVLFLQGFPPADLQFGPFQYGRPATGGGIPIGGVYAIWIGVVIVMYPLCRWYGRYKANHPEKTWLRYF